MEWGEPTCERLIAVATAQRQAEITLLICPQSRCTPRQWRARRDAVADAVSDLAVAEFHPAAGDPSEVSAARLPVLLRRSPDPLLQMVPQTSLRALSRHRGMLSPSEQAAVLAGVSSPPSDPREQIANANAATIARIGVSSLLVRLQDIARDRELSYARVGITAPSASPPLAPNA